MIKKLLFTILVIIFLANLSFSQERNNQYLISNSSSSACEINPAYFADIENIVNHTEQNIFAIFRAGKNETETVNSKRLNYLKTFLEKRRDWNKFNVIYARGEKTNDEGKIEFYIGGKLHLVVIAPKNKTPCMDCCGNELDYPQNLNTTQKHYKRRN